MNILGNSNCILHIINNMLKMQNSKLMDHGSRVGYLVAKMMEQSGAETKDIIDFANFWKDRTDSEQNTHNLDDWCL